MIAELMLLLAQATTSEHPGAKVFAQSCSIGYCHGSGGAANRGPRLRGRTFTAGYVGNTVRSGIPNTAMPAFAGRLKDEDLNAVVAWVESIATITEKSATADATTAPPIRQVPAEFAKGHDLFFDATKGTRCSTCHQVDGRGTNAGPDLTGRIATRSHEPKLLRQVTLNNGEIFPALPAAEDSKTVQVFDLTSPPPALRTIQRSQLRSMEPTSKWNHAEVAKAYSDTDLAEIGKYLNWLGQH